MKRDPELAERFANTLLEEIAWMRTELITQRKMIVAILSQLSKQPRRKIKDRAYRGRCDAIRRTRMLQERVGLKEPLFTTDLAGEDGEESKKGQS